MSFAFPTAVPAFLPFVFLEGKQNKEQAMACPSHLENRVFLSHLLDIFIGFSFLVGAGNSLHQLVKDHHLGQYGLPIVFFVLLNLGAFPLALIGSTLGQALLGIRMGNSDGEKPNLIQAYRICLELTFKFLSRKARSLPDLQNWHYASRFE